jgi:hypothetical protein
VAGVGIAHIAQFAGDLAHHRADQAHGVDHPVRQVAHRHAAGLVAQLLPQDARHVDHLEERAGGDEALAIDARLGQRAQMQSRHVAHVHHAKAEVGTARHTARKQLADQFDRGGVIAPPHRAEHDRRVDRNEFHPLPVLRHPFARGALGHSLGLGIGLHARPVDVGPVRLGKATDALAVAIDDRGHRRGLHEARDAGCLGEPQRAQHAFARRHDEFVFMARGIDAERRGHVADVRAAIHRRAPASILEQIDLEKPQRGVAAPQLCAQLGFAGEVANRGVHGPPSSSSARMIYPAI